MHYPTIVERSIENIAVMDVFSKLVQNRIIFIGSVIDDDLVNGVIAQLLYLDSISNDEIQIFINSPGGSVYDGLGLFDICEKIKSPITTVCVGSACSMGAILMLVGDRRLITKHSRIMLHQPSGGASGTSDDIEVTHLEIQKLKKELYSIVEQKTKLSDVEPLFRKDVWFTAEEALEAGIVTEIY